METTNVQSTAGSNLLGTLLIRVKKKFVLSLFLNQKDSMRTNRLVKTTDLQKIEAKSNPTKTDKKQAKTLKNQIAHLDDICDFSFR